jgi:hypothetical protein
MPSANEMSRQDELQTVNKAIGELHDIYLTLTNVLTSGQALPSECIHLIQQARGELAELLSLMTEHCDPLKHPDQQPPKPEI